MNSRTFSLSNYCVENITNGYLTQIKLILNRIANLEYSLRSLLHFVAREIEFGTYMYVEDSFPFHNLLFSLRSYDVTKLHITPLLQNEKGW